MIMKISVISFTDSGKKVTDDLKTYLKHHEVALYHKQGKEGVKDLKEWTKQQFEERNAIVFIGACGIAVRLIAPFLKDKLQDSPVICIDEIGRFVIPLLSGHMGGANDLAREIAVQIGAIPIITTATDIQETFAIDIFAKKNHLTIQNKEGIAKITSKVLQNERVDIVISPECTQLTQGILRLKPKEYIIGIGCRKGKEYQQIEAFITKWLRNLKLESSDILEVVSIDLKKEEEGIRRWCNSHTIPFRTFTKEALEKVEGVFSSSQFVKAQLGIDNVCERAAMLAAGKEGELILSKQAEKGMTLAIAKKAWQLDHLNQEGIIIEET